MTKMKFGIYIYMFGILAQGSSTFNVTDLSYLVDVQRQFCSTSQVCQSSVLSNESSVRAEPIHSSKRLPVIPPPWTHDACCGECSCDIYTCSLTESCCLETLDDDSIKKHPTLSMTCEYPQLRPLRPAVYPNIENPRWMYTHCPRQSGISVSEETIDRCENPEKYSDINTKMPVTDVATSYIYKNRYCAQCHNAVEDDLHSWNANLECSHGMLLPKSLKHVVKQVKASTHCNMLFSRPTSVAAAAANPLYQCKTLISKCNQTGLWKEHDALLEEACLAYTSVFDFRYKNVFCYLCNTDDSIGPPICSDLPGGHVFPDFSALLKLTPMEPETALNNIKGCRQWEQIYDPVLGVCRDLECLFPKTAENGTCVDIATSVGGVTFGIFLRATPNKDIFLTVGEEIDSSIKFLGLYLMDWFLEPFVYDRIYSIYIYEKRNESSKQVEEVTYRVEHFVFYLEIETIVLRPENVSVIEYLLEIHDTDIDVPHSIAAPLTYRVKVDVNGAEDVGNSQFNDSLQDTLQLVDFYQVGTSSVHQAGRIVVNKYNTCPSVLIDSREYSITQYTDRLYIKELDIFLSKNEVLIENSSDGQSFTIRICAVIFERLIEPFKMTRTSQMCDEESYTYLGIFSNVCSIVSIVFSVITISINVLFEDRTTQPWVNNILLCTVLIFAQAFFQFGSGQACNVSADFCQVIGILVHFSWLMVINWMNVCCIHMFRVFKCNQNQITTFNVLKTSLVYLACCTVVSTIPVSVVIGVSLFESDGHDVGYGGSMCYIRDRFMIAYAFALPVAIVIIINIALYIIVAVQIKTVSKVHKDKDGRKFLKIYSRLSTLTGGTWTFGLLGLFLDVAALDYIFTFLNATQGLFLFFAFVVNRRTLVKLKERFSSKSGNNRDKMKYAENKGSH